MASMTVRDLDDDVKRRFVAKAKAAGQSAEGYLREVVRRAAFADDPKDENETAEAWLARVREPLRRLDLTEEEQREIKAAQAEAAIWRSSDQGL